MPVIVGGNTAPVGTNQNDLWVRGSDNSIFLNTGAGFSAQLAQLSVAQTWTASQTVPGLVITGNAPQLDFSAGTTTVIRPGSTYFAVVNNANNANNLLVADGGNVTVRGSLQTGAPNGGTAQPWKFGAVATVSPSGQNRTIELDVGGTIYYLTAKTTNN